VQPPHPKGETRTDSRAVEDRKPPATIPAGLPGQPRPAPTADSSPPAAPLVGSRLQACTIRTRSRCPTPRGAIEETTTTWRRGRLQTPTVYNFERQPLKPAHEMLRGDTARRARESSGAAAVGPEDETRQCPEGSGLGLTAPRAAAHHRRPRRQRDPRRSRIPRRSRRDTRQPWEPEREERRDADGRSDASGDESRRDARWNETQDAPTPYASRLPQPRPRPPPSAHMSGRPQWAS
jgi:hypothetical protein